jgi:glyoxylase-like metal-dependent hydrolase (beta-lactamase superfamily II)
MEYPFSSPIKPGEIREVAEGVFWIRLALPFRLNHVNAWIIDDDGGWTIVDCGIDCDSTRAIWESTLSGFLAGRAVHRVIATHGHTDHVGAAGFLCCRTGARFEIALVEWMAANLRHAKHGEQGSLALGEFLSRHGGSPDNRQAYEQEFYNVTRYLGELPQAFQRLEDGRKVKFGGRDWHIIAAGGHADEHISFYCEDSGLLIGGDQILPQITPVVAVSHAMPDADPLGAYLRSLVAFGKLPAEVLVLPGHGYPFRGLHERLEQLNAHHEKRLNHIESLAGNPMTSFKIAQYAFPEAFAGNQTRLAVGETLAHLNRLVAQARLSTVTNKDGVITFVR